MTSATQFDESLLVEVKMVWHSLIVTMSGGEIVEHILKCCYQLRPCDGSFREHSFEHLFDVFKHLFEEEEEEKNDYMGGFVRRNKEKKYLVVEKTRPRVSHVGYNLPTEICGIVCEYLNVSPMFPINLFRRFESIPTVLSDSVLRLVGIGAGQDNAFMAALQQPVTVTNSPDEEISDIMISGGYVHRHKFYPSHATANNICANDPAFEEGFHRGYGNGYEIGRGDGYNDESRRLLLKDSCDREEADAVSRYDPDGSSQHKYAIGYLCGEARGYYFGYDLACPELPPTPSELSYGDYPSDMRPYDPREDFSDVDPRELRDDFSDHAHSDYES